MPDELITIRCLDCKESGRSTHEAPAFAVAIRPEDARSRFDWEVRQVVRVGDERTGERSTDFVKDDSRTFDFGTSRCRHRARARRGKLNAKLTKAADEHSSVVYL